VVTLALTARKPPGSRISYAPPVSGAELYSGRVGAMLGRPVNAAELFFFASFLFFIFFLVF
jgi:hypothetical protein